MITSTHNRDTNISTDIKPNKFLCIAYTIPKYLPYRCGAVIGDNAIIAGMVKQWHSPCTMLNSNSPGQDSPFCAKKPSESTFFLFFVVVVYTILVIKLNSRQPFRKLFRCGQQTGSDKKHKWFWKGERDNVCALKCVCITVCFFSGERCKQRPEDCRSDRHPYTKPQERLFWCYLSHHTLCDKKEKKKGRDL